MNIAVVTIMKDEPYEFILRWATSASDADHRVLVDTGSSGEQVTYAQHLGITVHEIGVRPWRFDVARNAALSLLPDCDTVVTLDVDEVLEPGWRDALEAVGPAPRHAYHYQWSPDVSFLGDRTHSRQGWMWRHPCHETLYRSNGAPEEAAVVVPGMAITHLADDSKPRAQYLPLLALAVKEAPDNDRMAHYYARELYFQGRWEQARAEFVRHLALPSAVWPAERAQSYRYLAKMDDFPERWLLKAAAEDPERREVWVDLAKLMSGRGQDVMAAGHAARALSIWNRSEDYMTEEDAWDDVYLESLILQATHPRMHT
jgi:glycosyltransferase involved in cell wall biosynthesis